MQEHELNTIMDVVSDPIKNVYDISSRKNLEEIQRIIRIFKINEETKHENKTVCNQKPCNIQTCFEQQLIYRLVAVEFVILCVFFIDVFSYNG